MTTPDVERRLAAVLERHADETMSRTDTRAELGRFQDRISEEPALGAPRWVVVAAAALTAAALALGVIWSSDVARDSDSEPAHEDRPAQTSDERVAQRFAEAFSAGDNERVASLLAEGASAPPGWRDYARMSEAFSTEDELQPCETTSVTEYATFIDCLFYSHQLGSEQLGLGPFGPGVLTVAVSDDEVRTFRLAYSDIDSGQGQARLFDRVGAWVRANHPEEWPFLRTQWSLVGGVPTTKEKVSYFDTLSPSEVDRWVRLWQRRVAEYVAAQQE